MDYYRPESPGPERSKNKTLKYFFGCFLILAGLAAFFAGKFYSTLKGPNRVVKKHLEAINSGDFELAYTQFSSRYKTTTTLGEFRTDLRSFAPLLPYKSYHLSRVEVNGANAIVEGTVTGRDGSIFPVHYELIREKDKWRIKTFQWTSPGARIAV
ncbi:MAG TPA: DUF4864 domain-containing protein [Acidobacteriota bacterium]|nr:DUF4864 domain-containing protein [Acidobacteriota bacterium]